MFITTDTLEAGEAAAVFLRVDDLVALVALPRLAGAVQLLRGAAGQAQHQDKHDAKNNAWRAGARASPVRAARR